MNILLDLMGSSLIAGIIFLLIFKLNLYSSTANYYSDNELRLQQNVKTLAEVINYDLRKIGYKYDSTAIVTAQPTRIQFYADLEAPGTSGHGVTDFVEYYLGDSTEATGTVNQRDKVLYRIVNHTDTIGGPTLGLVDLKFSYLDAHGLTTAFLDSIKYVKAEFWVEPYEYVSDYNTGQPDSTQFTYWELTINPRNI
ncbi:MAG: hypothetical protein OEM46_08255 [Ignavibacteria bacterium]|nr:hypothetical protein [Ignavibacteria bacterium]